MLTRFGTSARGWRLPALLVATAAVVAASAGPAPGQDRGTDRAFDHIGNGRFMVEIAGVINSAFTVVGGLESTTEVIEFRDGNDLTVRKRPGRTRYANIVLRRGYTGDPELWLWYKRVIDGAVERKAGSIILLSSAGVEIERYNFFEGWPVRYRNYDLDAESSGVVVEEIEIAVERIERG